MVLSESIADDLQSATVQLYATPNNPIPNGYMVGEMDTPDGATLRYAQWQPHESSSKGTVILLHGRSESIEKYYETIEDLRKRGFGVFTFDWRGQGASSRLMTGRKKGYIESFDQYLTDLETMLTGVALPDCKAPFFVLGHSTGALVALLAGPALANRIQRMVLTAPLVALDNLPFKQSNVHRLAGFLTFIGLGRNYITGSPSSYESPNYASNKLSTDKARFERNRQILAAHPDLITGAPTVTWLFAACQAMEQVNSAGFSNAISIPTLLIASGNDKIVPAAAVEMYGDKMRSGSYLTIQGAEHEIMHESDLYREQFLAAFETFIPGTGS